VRNLEAHVPPNIFLTVLYKAIINKYFSPKDIKQAIGLDSVAKSANIVDDAVKLEMRGISLYG